MEQATVSRLFIYPVKSLGGIELNHSNVESRGLTHDRRWMLVDEDGVFMTQRSDTRLALFRTGIKSDGLWIQNQAGESVLAPFSPGGERKSVQVWRDIVEAVQVSPEVDSWFSESLGQRCSLVYMPEDSVRQTSLDFTREGDRVGFADAFPVLVIGEASLGDLNGRLEQALPMNRFRGNIIVQGWDPYAEDRWVRLSIGGLSFRAAKRCGRCSVTATNQDTGEVGVEPLRTLADYRRTDKNVFFGAYFVPECTGNLRIGDDIRWE
jgi:uncharacterized protein YcbX